MRSYQEGEWEITTPVYLGSDSDVSKATQCPHSSWVEIGRDELDTDKRPTEAVTERCCSCVAIRMKLRPMPAKKD